MLILLLWMRPRAAVTTDSLSLPSSCLTVPHVNWIACIACHTAEVQLLRLLSPSRRLGCQDTMQFSISMALHMYKRGSHLYHKPLAHLCNGFADVIEDAAAGESRPRQLFPCPHRHGLLDTQSLSLLVVVQDLHCTALRLSFLVLQRFSTSGLGCPQNADISL